MDGLSRPEGLRYSDDDPLAEEHRLLAEWSEAEDESGSSPYYADIALKSHPSGQRLLNTRPAQARRLVLAAIEHARHWEQVGQQVLDRAPGKSQSVESHVLANWPAVWGRGQRIHAVLETLLRRALPLTRDDLVVILRWCGQPNLSSGSVPAGVVARAVERFLDQNPLDDGLQDAICQLAARLQASHDREVRRHASSLLQMTLAKDDSLGGEEISAARPSQPPPRPVVAGLPGVLQQLKRHLKLLPRDDEPSVTLIGPDHFPLPENSPLAAQHEQLTRLLVEVAGTERYDAPDLPKLRTGRALLQTEPSAMEPVLLAAAERHINVLLRPRPDDDGRGTWQSRYAATSLTMGLVQQPFILSRGGLFDLLLYFASWSPYEHVTRGQFVAASLPRLEEEAGRTPLTEGERYVLWLLREALISVPLLGTPTDTIRRLTALIGDGANFCLVPGEVWAEAVNEDFRRMSPVEQRKWSALWTHALTADASRPSAKWLKTAQTLVEQIGADQVRQALDRWLPLVAQGSTVRKLGARGAADTMHEENATCLRGLLWLTQRLPDNDGLARHLTTVALSAYKKIPGVGPRAVKVGNAAVLALSAMGTSEAVGRLAMLKVRIRFGSAQKEVEKAFIAAAEALGLPRDQIEEMAVPAYGLQERGRRRESFGHYQAELLVTGSDAQLNWFDANGRALKSVPAKVTQNHAESLKELKQALKDIQGMLPAQRDRIDSMFLAEKSWGFETWCERYLKHPLIGTIAGRLVWCVDGVPAIFLDDSPTDVQGAEITHGKTAEISLWHPAGRGLEEVVAWRRRLEQLRITQPFKQVHREVYVLTDAERQTRTYSNRFAAHVIRQHQFNALCAARGWKDKLRLMVDGEYPAAGKELPRWGLRAEFWVEPIGENYGLDTNESGVFLRLATDQVRFYGCEAAPNFSHAMGGGYRRGAAGPGTGNVNEPLPLEEVPPLVFSEIMRDIDLLVGVASVGNDPTWRDGGPGGRYRDYWESYSFGELSGTADTRKQVLERLVPRLKIADRCSLSDRFLVVRGRKRTYKIHLGSGNILMEPNDQYLCIVPDSRARATQDDLFLPFEGDNTLSIILSKAFLLADDTKIKDPTITRQIDGL